MQVLARDGLAACTARAVADASPLTKSAVPRSRHSPTPRSCGSSTGSTPAVGRSSTASPPPSWP